MTAKGKNTTLTTQREVIASLLLEDIDALVDKVEGLAGIIDSATEKYLGTIKQLEDASDAYHQAVLAANLRSKNEMVAYLETVSKTTVASTVEEQRTIVQGIVREAVGDEVTALKKAVTQTYMYRRIPLKDWWGFLLLGCTITAIISSATVVAIVKYGGLN